MMIIVGIALFLIYLYACFIGGSIAEEKGFSFGKFAFLCVFVPIGGFILVAALPDRENRNNKRTTSNSTPVDNVFSKKIVLPEDASTF